MSTESLSEIAKLMASNQGIGHKGPSYDRNSDDWGYTLDDLDGSYWAEHLGGPDDIEIEHEEYGYYRAADEDGGEFTCIEEECEEDEIDDVDEEEYEEQGLDEDDNEQTIVRLEAIVDWLAQSELATSFPNKRGFFVRKGPRVKLQDGSIIDLFDWLFEEGVRGGTKVAGYKISYSAPGSSRGEQLSFIEIVVNAPFQQRAQVERAHDCYEDIPF